MFVQRIRNLRCIDDRFIFDRIVYYPALALRMFLFFIVGGVRSGVATKHVANLLASMPDGANPGSVRLSYTSVVFSKPIDTCAIRPPI